MLVLLLIATRPAQAVVTGVGAAPAVTDGNVREATTVFVPNAMLHDKIRGPRVSSQLDVNCAALKAPCRHAKGARAPCFCQGATLSGAMGLPCLNFQLAGPMSLDSMSRRPRSSPAAGSALLLLVHGAQPPCISPFPGSCSRFSILRMSA